MFLKLSNISKNVKNGRDYRSILKNLNLQVNSGDSVAIKGRSGSGKTTLLNIIAGLSTIDEGDIYFEGKNISKYTIDERLEYRRKHIGIITQQLNLLDDRNIFENVALPLMYQRVDKTEIKKKVQSILSSMNMEGFINNPISNLSGGERQRIAIARALVKSPSILIADEPTGSLDEETEKDILSIFSDLQKNGMTIILVTHDDTVARSCNHIYDLISGNLKKSHILPHYNMMQ